MRKNQWIVLGTSFLLLMVFFIWQDLRAEAACGRAGIPPEHFTAEEWWEKGSEPEY